MSLCMCFANRFVTNQMRYLTETSEVVTNSVLCNLPARQKITDQNFDQPDAELGQGLLICPEASS